MKRILLIIITALLSFAICNAQKITDSGYRTIGHAKDLPMEGAALYFFFKL